MAAYYDNGGETMTEKELWTRQELADYLGVSLPTIHAMVKRGMPVMKSGWVVRYPIKEVKEWLRNDRSTQGKGSTSAKD